MAGEFTPEPIRAGDVKVRQATEADLDGLNDVYNEYVGTAHYTFDVEPMTIETWAVDRSRNLETCSVRNDALMQDSILQLELD